MIGFYLRLLFKYLKEVLKVLVESLFVGSRLLLRSILLGDLRSKNFLFLRVTPERGKPDYQ